MQKSHQAFPLPHENAVPWNTVALQTTCGHNSRGLHCFSVCDNRKKKNALRTACFQSYICILLFVSFCVCVIWYCMDRLEVTIYFLVLFSHRPRRSWTGLRVLCVRWNFSRKLGNSLLSYLLHRHPEKSDAAFSIILKCRFLVKGLEISNQKR